MLPSFDMMSVVDALAAVGGWEIAVLLRSRDVVCKGGICLRSSFSTLIAVFVRDKVMWPFSDMVAPVLLDLGYLMLGVYAAQCYEVWPFMAPAQAARVSGAPSLLCEKGTMSVGRWGRTQSIHNSNIRLRRAASGLQQSLRADWAAWSVG